MDDITNKNVFEENKNKNPKSIIMAERQCESLFTRTAPCVLLKTFTENLFS